MLKDRSTLTPYRPKAFLDMGSNWLTKQGWLDTAVSFGLVVPSDYSDGKFSPSKAITRYEIAVMVDRAIGKVYPASQPLTEKLPFTDADQIPEWVRGYISEAAKAGVLTGYPNGSFGHSKPATRAEAVVMVQRMLGYTFHTLTRRLDGEIMIPIYDFSPTYPENNQGIWDKSTNIITLDVYNPGYYTS